MEKSRTLLFQSPFPVNALMLKVECHGQAMQAELEAEQQTPLIYIRRTPSQFEAPTLTYNG